MLSLERALNQAAIVRCAQQCFHGVDGEEKSLHAALVLGAPSKTRNGLLLGPFRSVWASFLGTKKT